MMAHYIYIFKRLHFAPRLLYWFRWTLWGHGIIYLLVTYLPQDRRRQRAQIFSPLKWKHSPLFICVFVLPDAGSKSKGNRLGSPSFSWHFHNVSSKWGFADSFIYTLCFARSLTAYLPSAFSLIFHSYGGLSALKTASFIQKPWFMPFIIRISNQIQNTHPQRRKMWKTTFFTRQ